MKILWKAAVLLTMLALLWAPVCGGTALAASQAEIAGAEEKIRLAAAQGKESVDLSGYSITTDEIQNVYNSAHENDTSLSLVTNVSWSYNTSNKKVSKLSFTYLDTATNIKQMKADYEVAAKEVLACVDDGMSDAEKVAAVHDYLILNTVRTDEGDISKTPYSVLALHKGNTLGIIYAFKDLMTRLGIACIVVYSTDINFAWNMVQVDGTWYHVDLLSDDPPCPSSSGWHNEDTKMLGRVRHTHFLLSDETLKGLDRTSWVSGFYFQEDSAPQAASKLYEGRYGEITSGMFYSDGYWYYSLSGVLTRSRFDLSESSALPTEGSVGFISPAAGWIYYLSTGSDGATKEIRRISTGGTEDMSVLRVGAGENNTEEITEILIEDGCLNYMVYSTNASGSAQYASRSLKLSLIASGVEDGGAYNAERTITFAEGTALLDGTEVLSGAAISSEGEHTFVITDAAGDARTLSFRIDTTAPVISGIENGASYDRAPAVTFNEGIARLDGEPFEPGVSIVKGEHTLVVTDAAGNTATVVFTVLHGSSGLPSTVYFAFVPIVLAAIFAVFLLLRKRTGKRDGGPRYPSAIPGEPVPSPNPAKAARSEPSRTAAPVVSAPAAACFPPNSPSQTLSGGSVLYCGECGAKNDCEDIFCGACGAKLYQPETQGNQPPGEDMPARSSPGITAASAFPEIPAAAETLSVSEDSAVPSQPVPTASHTHIRAKRNRPSLDIKTSIDKYVKRTQDVFKKAAKKALPAVHKALESMKPRLLKANIAVSTYLESKLDEKTAAAKGESGADINDFAPLDTQQTSGNGTAKSNLLKQAYFSRIAAAVTVLAALLSIMTGVSK